MMVAFRFVHKSPHELSVGDELVPPTVLCERSFRAFADPEEFANFPVEYCDGQYDNVYFSMLDSWASHNYGHDPHIYIVEPLSAVEPDPEDTYYLKATGSLRAPRARIVEVLA